MSAMGTRRRGDGRGIAPRTHWSSWAIPGVLLAILVAIDLLDGADETILGVLVMVPFVAASILPPVPTAIYGGLALTSAVLLGAYDQAYGPGQLAAQTERLVILALSGGLAVAVAGLRVAREAKLSTMTSIADSVQQAILRRPPPEVGGVRLVVDYQAALAGARIGGDVYEVQPTPWGVRVLVGDVRGKGLGAVRLAGAIAASFRERAGERPCLNDLRQDLDRTVCRESDDPEEFATALLAEIDPRRQVLRLLSAGHPPPLLVRKDTVRLLETPATGIALGLGEIGRPGATTTVGLRPGDRLLFYTDGTAEARAPDGSFFALEEFALRALSSGTLDSAVRDLATAVRDWTGSALLDDAALLAAELVGSTAAGPEP